MINTLEKQELTTFNDIQLFLSIIFVITYIYKLIYIYIYIYILALSFGPGIRTLGHWTLGHLTDTVSFIIYRTRIKL